MFRQCRGWSVKHGRHHIIFICPASYPASRLTKTCVCKQSTEQDNFHCHGLFRRPRDQARKRQSCRHLPTCKTLRNATQRNAPGLARGPLPGADRRQDLSGNTLQHPKHAVENQPPSPVLPLPPEEHGCWQRWQRCQHGTLHTPCAEA